MADRNIMKNLIKNSKIKRKSVKRKIVNRKNENLLSEIDSARKKIREKLFLLKNDLAENEKMNELFFDPVKKGLKDLASKVSVPIKMEKYDEKEFKTEKKEKKENEEEDQEGENNDDNYDDDYNDDDVSLKMEHFDNFDQSERLEDEKSMGDGEDENNSTLVATGDIVQKFLDLYGYGGDELDQTYGPRKINNKWFLGSDSLEFDDENFTIGSRTFPITQGLANLIFQKRPVDHSQEDLSLYKEIMKQTNLFRRSYEENSSIMGNKGYKYVHLIKPILESENILKNNRNQLGGYLKNRFSELTNKRTLVYYHNPNDIVERLKILLGSDNAGNFSHRNEILEITNELRRRKLIR